MIDTVNQKTLNAEAIRERLQDIRSQAEIAKIIPSQLQGIFVRKIDDQLELYCYDPDTRSLSECMSRIDLINPLNLISPYTQTAFMTSCWGTTTPKRIYIAGFGGGCLGQVFHHYFPKAVIDGSEVDPAMLRVAETYFGVTFDTRYDVRSGDGREDLESREPPYDIIIIDVFFGNGTHANHLATSEFFEMCSRKLTANGVLCVNIIEKDPFHKNKIAAIESAFDYCYGWNVNGARVTFASQEPLNREEFLARLSQFVETENLTFPVMDRAEELSFISPDPFVSPLSDQTVLEQYEKMFG